MRRHTGLPGGETSNTAAMGLSGLGSMPAAQVGTGDTDQLSRRLLGKQPDPWHATQPEPQGTPARFISCRRVKRGLAAPSHTHPSCRARPSCSSCALERQICEASATGWQAGSLAALQGPRGVEQVGSRCPHSRQCTATTPLLLTEGLLIEGDALDRAAHGRALRQLQAPPRQRR